jgi:hypothetical protein
VTVPGVAVARVRSVSLEPPLVDQVVHVRVQRP